MSTRGLLPTATVAAPVAPSTIVTSALPEFAMWILFVAGFTAIASGPLPATNTMTLFVAPSTTVTPPPPEFAT